MSRSGRFSVLASLVAVCSLAACTSPSDDEDAPRKSVESTGPAAAPDRASDVTKAPAVRCQDPASSVVAMAKSAIATHPGPVQRSVLVRAGRTGTGTWYVIGIDQAYAMDDGTLTGEASRSVALTDAPVGVNFIPLGDGVTHKPFETSWDRVSWTGSRLAAGQRALRKAISCLDEADNP